MDNKLFIAQPSPRHLLVNLCGIPGDGIEFLEQKLWGLNNNYLLEELLPFWTLREVMLQTSYYRYWVLTGNSLYIIDSVFYVLWYYLKNLIFFYRKHHNSFKNFVHSSLLHNYITSFPFLGNNNFSNFVEYKFFFN